jgi:hypothetical protein
MTSSVKIDKGSKVADEVLSPTAKRTKT